MGGTEIVLSLINGALAIKLSDLLLKARERSGTTSLTASEVDTKRFLEELKLAIADLEKEELIKERKVGDEPIYQITAKGATEADKPKGSLLSLAHP